MKLVGLTGGISSGKTTVASFLKDEFCVLDMDQMARDVVTPGQPTLARIVAAFGDEVLEPSGQLDRKKLGGLIFADGRKRRKLNTIMFWPLLRLLVWHLLCLFARGEDVVVLDAPLLFESGLYRFVKVVVVVSVSQELQLERLMRRDGIDEGEARRKMASQMPLTEKVKLADLVVDNSSTIEETNKQVLELIAAVRHRQTLFTRSNVLALMALSFGFLIWLVLSAATANV